MLISRFYSNDFNITNKRKFISKHIFNKTNFQILLVLLLCLYLLSNAKKLIFSSNFEFFNELLINNGFVIKNIEIQGTKYLNKDDILKVISSYNNINIFSINVKKLYKEISNNTWVKRGSIKIVYPNTIKIFLTEKEPVAIWQDKFGNKLISKSGDFILEKNFKNFKNFLPIIIGKNAHKNINPIFKILNLQKEFVKNVWSLTYVNERRWDVHFKQGLTIRLPSTKIREAWQKAASLNENFKILNIGLTEIDLRNHNQILGKINVDKKLIFKKRN